MNGPIDVAVSDIPFPTLGDEVGARLEELIGRGAGYVELVDGIALSGYSPAGRKRGFTSPAGK